MSAVTQLDEPYVDKVPVYDARELTQDGDLARIKLSDQVYTLRITRTGKLILTK
ncbi:hemin uptake protein HemP [Roseobacter weihaiensis]|uniref:hemin uptake protein HemP n=1 Tax=Roseobacter weihaiensis TaxID=2763262 RepID=UPI001D0B3328|nr:hemin uptake protein HemP [Roseobacter sp. H9]